MKKTVFGFVLALGIMAALSSCSTTYKMVVDENVPANQSTIVTFESDTKSGFFRKTAEGVLLQVREHNDRNILDDLYGSKELWSNDKTILTIPAGNNRFLFDASFMFEVELMYRVEVHTQKVPSIEIRYDLEPGKKYRISGTTKRTKFNLLGMDNYDLYVGIYDVTGKKTLLKEWKVGEFVGPW